MMRRLLILGVLFAAAVTTAAGISNTASWQLPDPDNKAEKVADFLVPDPRNIIVYKD